MPKISELPLASTATGSELIPLVQNGVTSQALLSNVAGNLAGPAQAAAAAAASSATAASNSAINAATSATNAAASAATVLAGQSSGVIGYDTVANMNADLAHPAQSVAYVINDTPSNNGIYRKVGASGSGSWTYQSNFTAVYFGEATTSTNPGTQVATSRAFYSARTPGTYTNFSNLVVNSGEIAFLRWTGAAWTKDVAYDARTRNATLGEVVRGAIYPSDTGVSTQVAIKVQPNTIVVGMTNDHKRLQINVTAGTNLLIDSATTHLGIDSSTNGLFYCTTAGQLGITTGPQNLPSGEYVILGAIYQSGTATGGGGTGALFPVAPFIPSNHFFWARATDIASWPNQRTRGLRVNLKDLGAVGDGVTDDSQAFRLWASLRRGMNQIISGGAQGSWWSERKKPYEVYLPDGTYLCSVNTWATQDTKITGESRSAIVKWTGASFGTSNAGQYQDITLWNWVVNTVTGIEKFVANNTKFKYDPGIITSGTYLINPGTKDYEVVGCEWDYAAGTCYIPLYVTNFRNVLIENNVFNSAGTGYHSHAIRIESPGAEPQNVRVRNNYLWNGTTGIFFGSNRVRPTENVVVEGNHVYNVQEEGISFDGFGNNTGLCPVIGTGTITAVSNDANGRLVITPALLFNNGTPNVALNISDRTDWTNFYFTFEGGNGSTAALSEGIDGTYVRVYAYDGTAGTLTLDSYMAAADVVTGSTSLCGVHAGFFNVTVRHNMVEGSVGTLGSPAHTYATALSMYLNVFGFQIYGNRVIGCAGGINVAGGSMLTTYRSLAWNVHVYDNDFINCTRLNAVGQDQGAVRFESYGLTVNQYNNSFHHNTVIGATRMKFDRQRNFTCEGNTIPGVTSVVRQYCAQALPTAGAAWMGRTKELITEDGSGNATDIHYYMCKAVSGVYTWVQIA